MSYRPKSLSLRNGMAYPPTSKRCQMCNSSVPGPGTHTYLHQQNSIQFCTETICKSNGSWFCCSLGGTKLIQQKCRFSMSPTKTPNILKSANLSHHDVPTTLKTRIKNAPTRISSINQTTICVTDRTRRTQMTLSDNRCMSFK